MQLLTIETMESDFLSKIAEMNLPALRFSTTPDCDANCSFCHNEGRKIGIREDETKKPPFLSEDEVKYIARYFRPYFDEVKFTGGEPTTTSNLANLVRIFSNNGYECSMVTNGALFDNDLQLELKEAGLTRVNVSLPTLDETQYNQFFGVNGRLPRVLRNLRGMAENYERTKVNFMASDDTVPSQIANMDNLSSGLGVTISLIELARASTLEEPMSLMVISYLAENLGISTTEQSYERAGRRSIITTSSGAKWEIDDFRNREYRENAFDNVVCTSCNVRERCVEGPYALRIGYDGTARPCLIRSDNVLEFNGDYENN